METWIIMVSTNVFLIAVFIAVGVWLSKSPPPRRPRRSLIANGYAQTKMATVNDDTWDFANRDYGRRTMRIGFGAIPVVVVTMVPVVWRSEEVVAYVGAGLTVVLIAAFLLAMVWTERALRATFTADGTRRDRHVEHPGRSQTARS
ncbi:MAG: hypothetical protein FWE61_11735 [Micrococcales bacterium]|nr:hypothetical protein [Micrococcales bacterium]